ncbi:diaminopropionate ammonia-lyase [Streptomyces sp. TP-A0874]|uniref:diaminopropionate ammonia-lyase n=1 Tax=Streptomyces sp. TP-A0874 TaxID=549819 RepID=UPI0008537201|nr:diaminopropionate ammonia-lyase [Streptomyces sp. TP-A0874]
MTPLIVPEHSWCARPAAADWSCPPPPSTPAELHRSLPAYAATPLTDVPGLAAEWGVRRVVVKDESARLGLPAFKALGVYYALYRMVQDHLGGAPVAPDIDSLRAAVRRIPDLELVTATDGNHGRALAHVARTLGVPSRIFVPDVVPQGAIDAIRKERADVVVRPENYDETVALAAADARGRPGAVLVQDTAWEDYEIVPQYIVDGYSTMFVEIDEQLGADRAALVVTPVGVGSLAQAVINHYKSRGRPVSVLGVEPDTAACVLTSLRAERPVSVPTGSTVMAGLNCGTPSSLAWPYLRDGLDAVAVVTDAQSLTAARQLADAGIPAGPCGAACVSGVRSVLADPAGRAALGLDAGSVVVLLSTEKSRQAEHLGFRDEGDRERRRGETG